MAHSGTDDMLSEPIKCWRGARQRAQTLYVPSSFTSQTAVKRNVQGHLTAVTRAYRVM